MDKNTLDLVKQAMDGNADEFRSAFDDIMNNKVSNAVEVKYDDMFGSTVIEDPVMPEEDAALTSDEVEIEQETIEEPAE